MTRGFSLVEVVIAMTLLSIAMLSVAASGVIAARLQREGELQEEMLLRATGLLDSLIAHDVLGSGTVEADRYQLAWQSDSVRLHVMARTGARDVFVLDQLR